MNKKYRYDICNNLRAVVILTTEELSELAEVIPLVTLLVLALLVPSPHAGVEIFLQPVGVWERQIWECSLPLYKVPRGPDVVVPGDDSLHRVPHHVHVYWHVQIKSIVKVVFMILM